MACCEAVNHAVTPVAGCTLKDTVVARVFADAPSLALRVATIALEVILDALSQRVTHIVTLSAVEGRGHCRPVLVCGARLASAYVALRVGERPLQGCCEILPRAQTVDELVRWRSASPFDEVGHAECEHRAGVHDPRFQSRDKLPVDGRAIACVGVFDQGLAAADPSDVHMMSAEQLPRLAVALDVEGHRSLRRPLDERRNIAPEEDPHPLWQGDTARPIRPRLQAPVEHEEATGLVDVLPSSQGCQSKLVDPRVPPGDRAYRRPGVLGYGCPGLVV